MARGDARLAPWPPPRAGRAPWLRGGARGPWLPPRTGQAPRLHGGARHGAWPHRAPDGRHGPEVGRRAGETSGRAEVRRADGCQGSEVALGTRPGRYRTPGERYGSEGVFGAIARHGPEVVPRAKRLPSPDDGPTAQGGARRGRNARRRRDAARIHAGCLLPLCPGRLHALQESAQRGCTARPESVLGAGCLHAAHGFPGGGPTARGGERGQPIREPPPARETHGGRESRPRQRAPPSDSAVSPGPARRQPQAAATSGPVAGLAMAKRPAERPHAAQFRTASEPARGAAQRAKPGRETSAGLGIGARRQGALDACARRSGGAKQGPPLGPHARKVPPPRGAKHGALPFAPCLPARIGSPPVRRLPARRHRRQPGSRCCSGQGPRRAPPRAGGARPVRGSGDTARAEHHLGTVWVRGGDHGSCRAPPRSR